MYLSVHSRTASVDYRLRINIHTRIGPTNEPSLAESKVSDDESALSFRVDINSSFRNNNNNIIENT